MKKFSILFALLLMLQSCSVYHSGTVSVDEAVAAESKVKVITEDHEKYKFQRLEKENDHLVGYVKPLSGTAKKLTDMPSQPEGRFLKVDLSNIAVETIKLRNNTLSTIINIAIPVVAVVAPIAVVATAWTLDY